MLSRATLIRALGLFFWYQETKFFGWNDRPGSIAELFADALVLMFFVAAFAVSAMEEGKVTVKVGGGHE